MYIFRMQPHRPIRAIQAYVLCFFVGGLCFPKISNNNEFSTEEETTFTPVSSEEINIWKEKAIRKRVAIIGGGASGLSALKTFVTNGFDDVILLEAQDRLGGRIQTFRNERFHIEEGAEWIHGEDNRNVVYKIAKELQQLATGDGDYKVFVVRENGSEVKNDYSLYEKVHSIVDETDENGVLEPFYDVGYGEYFIRRLKEEPGFQNINKNEYNAWMHYLEQIVNSIEGTGNWTDISAMDADRFVDYGEDQKWKSGFDTLVKYFMSFLKSSHYFLNSPVTQIFWDLEDTDGVLIKTSNNEYFLVEKVLVTVSVGCLKKWRDSVFVPPIPDPLRSSLQDIELGNANKVFCGWSEKWWGNQPFDINVLWTEFDLPKDKEWLYGVVEIFSLEEDVGVLRAFVSGKYSLLMEEKDELEVKNDFIFLLKRILENFHDIPEPNFFKRTKWNSNPWTFGSYESYITPEGHKKGLHSREIFRQPLLNSRNFKVIHWAGEHTHDTRYGTVDGAVEAGFREASRILKQNDTIL